MSPAVAAANNSATATAARKHDNQRALDERRKERGRKRKGGGEEQQTCSVAHSLSRSIAPSMRPASARHTNSSLGDTPIFIQTWFCHLNAYASTNGQHPNEYPNLAFPSSLAESAHPVAVGSPGEHSCFVAVICCSDVAPDSRAAQSVRQGSRESRATDGAAQGRSSWGADSMV